MTKQTKYAIKTLKALVNLYKGQPDNLVNKIWSWHQSEINEDSAIAGYNQAVREFNKKLKELRGR